jgi:hypothetical protein
MVLKSPFKEGKPSKAFKQARKSQLQIYRILANQHYPHLVELLQGLEYCLSQGYQNPSLIQTKNQSRFSSGISELFVSLFLLNNGFSVTGFDHVKAQEGTPDIIATKNDLSLLLEVYHPRDWEGLDLFLDDIDLYLKYLDRPLDFIFDINNKLISNFDDSGSLLYFDPWIFSEAMENKRYRLESIRKIISYIDSNLNESCPTELFSEFCFDSYNIKTVLKIKEIKLSHNIYPSRYGSFSPPILTGYAPEGMFDLLVKKRIKTKLRKEQLFKIAGNHIRILIVDITRLAYWNEFEHPVYLSKFKSSILSHLNSNTIKADILVFITPRVESRGGLKINLLFKKDTIDNTVLQTIFKNISDKIIVA